MNATRILAAARLVKRGEWTTYGDIATAVTGSKRAARVVAAAAAGAPGFPNAHRVLRLGGVVERGSHPTAREERERAAEKLRLEGVEFDSRGRADPARRVHWDELQRRTGGIARG